VKTLTHLLYELKIKDALPHVYLDMDGVIVNLEKGAFKLHGKQLGDVPKPARWQKISDTKDFWKDLEWMPGSKKLWNFLKPYEPSIMSAYAKSEPNSAKGKEDWLKKNVEKLPRSRINLVMRSDKQRFAKDGRTHAPNILIDDHEKNIREWEAKGGIGIHHTDVNRTIARLKEIGFA
jgi:5'(3')-deoxyribonucleotidase